MIAALAADVDWTLHSRLMQPTVPTPRSRARIWGKRLGLGLLAFVVVSAVAAVVAGLVLDEPRPVGTPGPEADALARRMEAAVRADRWEQTGAVQWTFFVNHHLWDKQRGFVEVRQRDLRVLLRTSDQTGVAYRGGEALRGEELREALDSAWGYFCNDSFWLNPVVKLFDPGTTRSIVQVEGRDALLVEYSSGGVTPGDAYLWLVDDDGTPNEWRMWVGILPVGGIAAPWDGFVTLSTGARVATRHGDGLLGFQLEDVRGAATLAELVPGEDPFAPLLR